MNKTKFSAPSHLQSRISYEHSPYFQDLIEIEWRGQLQSSTYNKKFRIKYYGEIFEAYQLICASAFAPERICAIDIETGEEILVFDGCQHGYDPMFCDVFTAEQIENRPMHQFFKDQDQEEIFEVIISVYHNIDYDEEMDTFVNEDGEIELMSGEIISPERLKSDGFDFAQIKIINSLGHVYSIFERELA